MEHQLVHVPDTAHSTHTHTQKKTNDGKCLFLVGGIHVRSDVVEGQVELASADQKRVVHQSRLFLSLFARRLFALCV